MAQRFWLAKWHMGYVGTDGEESIDLLDDFPQEVIDKITDEEAEDYVCEIAKDFIMNKIEWWAEPLEK